MMPTFGDWLYQEIVDHPDALPADTLIEVRAEAIYRALYLMERGGAKADRAQAVASLRSWVRAVDA